MLARSSLRSLTCFSRDSRWAIWLVGGPSHEQGALTQVGEVGYYAGING